MRMRSYLLAAFVIFVAAVTGSDLIARITIAGKSFGDAVGEHLHWLSVTLGGVAILFLPFGGTALICAAANRRSPIRAVLVLFLIALAAIAYGYFVGFQASQAAFLDKRWTAAALSIGLLPFFVGSPVLIVVAIIAAIIVMVDRRRTGL